METPKASPNVKSDDSAWYFLAEFSLGEFISNHDQGGTLITGPQFQALREYSMPPAWVENMENTLADFVKGVQAHLQQGGVDLPVRIRVFCQKKPLDDANAADAGARSCRAGRAPGKEHAVPGQGAKRNGGWGFFLIERGGNISGGTSTSGWNSVDLYLFKEGD